MSPREAVTYSRSHSLVVASVSPEHWLWSGWGNEERRDNRWTSCSGVPDCTVSQTGWGLVRPQVSPPVKWVCHPGLLLPQFWDSGSHVRKPQSFTEKQ